RTGCGSADGALLTLRSDPEASRDALTWRANTSSGTASGALGGDPTKQTDYALCVYDGHRQLVASAGAPAAGRCGKKRCWAAAKGGGFRYADGRRAGSGIKSLVLGSTTSTLVAGGGGAGVPKLPLATLPLTVQLANGDGACWTSTLKTAAKSTS